MFIILKVINTRQKPGSAKREKLTKDKLASKKNLL
jgi:hypothetical protein